MDEQARKRVRQAIAAKLSDIGLDHETVEVPDPGDFSFTVDRRINPEEDFDTGKDRLVDLLRGFRDSGIDLDVEILQQGHSAGVAEDGPVARALARNIEEVTGRKAEFEMCPGLLEIRFYAALGIPAFAYGPGLLSVSHRPDESIRIEDIHDCAAVYALTALDVLDARQ